MKSHKAETKQTYSQRLLKTLEYIEQNLDQSMSLDELASVAHFSPYHFHRIFKGMVGESVKSYIRRLKLERAAKQLVSTVRPVTEIAFRAGYETHESFTRAFNMMFRSAPSDYRKSNSYFQTDHDLEQRLKKGEQMTATNVELEMINREPVKIAYVRHIGPYGQCLEAWETLKQFAIPAGLFCGETEFLGLCYDDPEVTPPEKIRYDACITVAEGVAGSGEVGIKTLAGGKFAKYVYVGSYDKMEQTYCDMISKWIPAQGLEVSSQADAVSIESYKNSPEDTPPEELITEIYIPVL